MSHVFNALAERAHSCLGATAGQRSSLERALGDLLEASNGVVSTKAQPQRRENRYAMKPVASLLCSQPHSQAVALRSQPAQVVDVGKPSRERPSRRSRGLRFFSPGLL